MTHFEQILGILSLNKQDYYYFFWGKKTFTSHYTAIRHSCVSMFVSAGLSMEPILGAQFKIQPVLLSRV